MLARTTALPCGRRCVVALSTTATHCGAFIPRMETVHAVGGRGVPLEYPVEVYVGSMGLGVQWDPVHWE